LIHRKVASAGLDIVCSRLQPAPAPEISMRRLLTALSTPIDPVVAVHASSEDADATVRRLGQAGYGRGMLAVVGQGHATRDGERFPKELASAPWNWATSGLAWGGLWAACTALATLAMPRSGMGFAILAVLGAVSLVLHVWFAWRVVALAPIPTGGIPAERQVSGGRRGCARACQFLVLVRGSRSEIALARTILAH
jgi:hypothetical protein